MSVRSAGLKVSGWYGPARFLSLLFWSWQRLYPASRLVINYSYAYITFGDVFTNRRGGATATASHIRKQNRVSVGGSTRSEMASDNALNEVASKVKPSVSNTFFGRLGHMEEFSPDNAAAWPTYLERIQFYFTPNGVVEEEQQRAVLCIVCGPATYAILRTLCSPATPAEKPYADIQPGESIADFVSDLRRLSEHCEFGVSLEDMLRDRLVCGVRDEALQRRLLAETALDFKKTYEKAVAAEYATRQTAVIRGALPPASDLYRMDQALEGHKPGGKQGSSKQSMTGRCSCCNGDHDATSCGFRYSVCHFCKRKGHIVRACQQKEAARSKAKSGNKRPGKWDRSGLYGLYHISSALTAFTATVMVNGRQISMEVDSGSVCSIVNLRTLSRLGISKALRQCSRGVRTYTQQPVWVVGEVDVPVQYSGREGKLPLLVTKGCGISILGRDWFIPLGISLEELHQLNGTPVSNSSRREGQPAARDHSKVVTSVRTVLQDYSGVFKPGLGKSTVPPVRIEVAEQAMSKFYKSRQVPFALLPKVEEAIEQTHHCQVRVKLYLVQVHLSVPPLNTTILMYLEVLHRSRALPANHQQRQLLGTLDVIEERLSVTGLHSVRGKGCCVFTTEYGR
ncbi:hypothetical protein MTO96_029888 [Rhipicephalus appendiculatus]